MSAIDERRWILERWWGQVGWRHMGGFEGGAKKWEAHKAWLIKHGYLEQDPTDDLHQRITLKGAAWLKEMRP